MLTANEMNKKMCKIGLIVTIELEMIELYIVIMPVPAESVSEKNPQVLIYCLCQLFVIQAEFSLLDLFFNQTLCLLYVSGKNSADSSLKMRAVQ